MNDDRKDDIVYGEESSKERQEETTTTNESKEEEKERQLRLLKYRQPTEDEVLKFALSGTLVGKCKICKQIIVMENSKELNHQCHLPSPL